MKKVLLILSVFMLSAGLSFSADFNPKVLTLTSPASITYAFDGSQLTIPVNVAGTSASMWLIINTKGKAANIVNVQNGYLGWHYVNKIDTTVYISPKFERDAGQNNLAWDGKGEGGAALAPGDYSYYVWGYDAKTPRLLASNYAPVGFDWESQFTHIEMYGTDGLPLAKPMIMGSRPWWHVSGDADSLGTNAHGNVFKWILGGDPVDKTLIQTTWCNIYVKSGDYNTLTNSTFSYGAPVFNPTDYNTFYQCCVNVPQQVDTMLKWTWVSGGDAIQDMSWLGWDALTWDDKGEQIAFWSQKPSTWTDKKYIYANSPGLHQKTQEWNKLRVVTFDGEVIVDKMMHEWYFPDDPNPHGYINGAFHSLYADPTANNHWFIGSHTSCMFEMIDTTRLLVDENDNADMTVFKNQNGDYFMDSAYAPTLETKWYCLADDKTTSMRRDSIAIDHNGFSIIGCSYLGITSFGVATQDGTGISYMSFADDTVSDDANVKLGGQIVDSGSAYDGLYWGGVITAGMEPQGGLGNPVQRNANFIAFDSTGGIITDQPVAVENETPVAFAVAQNSPNPFNPTTTINFTVPKSDRVTVEVFNVAGQKVETLVNGAMSAGKHSVVWNAAGKSAGVYFYTVKAGSFSKTVKMTLLK